MENFYLAIFDDFLPKAMYYSYRVIANADSRCLYSLASEITCGCITGGYSSMMMHLL